MIATRAFEVSLGEWRVRLYIPYRFLDGFNDGGVELLADGFVAPKEACRECVLDRGIDLLAEGREEVVGVIVDFFVDDHRLYLGAGQPAKGIDKGLDDLTDIRILSEVLFG